MDDKDQLNIIFGGINALRAELDHLKDELMISEVYSISADILTKFFGSKFFDL